MLDFDDWYAGPNTENHPANQDLRALESSAEYCSCCKFMYDAAASAVMSGSSEQQIDSLAHESLPTQLGFTRAEGEHYLVIKAAKTSAQELAQLRMAHCKTSLKFSFEGDTDQTVDDWLPFRYFPRTDSPTSSCTLAHLVPKEPKLEYISSRIKHWMTDCDFRHPDCPSATDTVVPLPTRVLRVEKKGSQVSVQLEDGIGRRGRYIALSYAWGKTGQFSLTTQTEKHLRAGLSANTFARTIREAMELTHALGFCYLWIDALCIRQDSRSDWEVQASQMAQVYSKATLTLIAARSIGVETGFLKPTSPCAAYCGSVEYQGSRKPLFLTHGKTTQFSSMPPDPLSLRAWTLQEENLSKRKVKFTSKQMVWHCQSAALEEQESDRIEARHSSLPTHFTFPNFEGDTLHTWKAVVRNYAARQLTVQSDRLPAISGLASLYKAQTGLTYLAGLWSGPHLFEFLLWFRTSKSAGNDWQAEYLAPSWSWVSVHGQVDFKRWVGLWSNHNHVATCLDYSVTLKGSNAFGEITEAYLDLSAPAVITTIATIHAVRKHDPDSMSCKESSVHLQSLFPGHIMESICAQDAWPRFRLDHSDYGDDLQVHFVVLGHEWWDDEDYGMYGILVAPISVAKRTFRRIGMFDKFPKFRSTDRELSMNEMIAKRQAAKLRFMEQYALTEMTRRFALLSPQEQDPHDAEKENEENLRGVAEFEDEWRERTQTIPGDIDFQYFRII